MLKKIWGTCFILSLATLYWGALAHAEGVESKETIYLESKFVGDKRQPLKSHFIPWEKTPSADGLRWNVEPDLSDDTLKLVDKHVMRRLMDVYGGMNLEQSK
ncbi:MAG: hypothetical protein ACRBCI_11870 [Cellvibrionaceae bacterium]